MKTTLKDIRTGISKTIILIPRSEEILITTEDGKESASLKIGIMDGDIKQEDGTYITQPTNSYWVIFNPKVCHSDKNLADVFVDETSGV